MKPLHFLTLLPLALVGLFVAEKGAVSARQSEAGEAAFRQFQRDLPLIEALVDEGLQIAGEDDAIRRALACNRLADGFAREIRGAARKKEIDRVADLSNHLQEVLTRGVAGNVAVARTQLPKDGSRTSEMERIGAQVASSMQTMEAELEGFSPSEDKLLIGIMAKVQKARAEVDNAVKGRVRDKDKDKSKGKGFGKDRKGKK